MTSAATPSTSTATTRTMITTPAKPVRLMPPIFTAGSFLDDDWTIIQRGMGCFAAALPTEEGGMAKRERTGRRYRSLVARQRALGLPCWICGGGIRYDLPGGHPLSFEYDHYFPASRWREFGYGSQHACIHDPDNGRSSHRICNEKRQDAMPWEKRFKALSAGRKAAPAPPAKASRAN